uniref:Sterile alpha motif domain containing 14 n=1 Tax=Acanthochromis polyacanthus TaxID=80966 RepID=A0A3Q1FW15_9TELE
MATGQLHLNEAIPETELLDNSIQKGRAQLSVKTRRHRPSRSRYRDSVSSTEGDDSLDRKVEVRASERIYLTLTSQVRRSPEDEGTSLAAPPRGRYHQLTNATSQEALVTPSSSPSKSCPSSDCSPVYLRRNRRPDSEVLVSDTSRDTSPADPGSPTVVFDKKTKRRFLDLGEPSESPSRTSGSFVSFSWFTEGRGSLSSSGTPPCSPKLPTLSSPRPRKSHSQVGTEPTCRPAHLAEHLRFSLSTSSSQGLLKTWVPHSGSSSLPGDEPSSLVSSWSTQQVCQWLRGLNMDQYVPEFTARDIDGQQLLQMDGSKLKGLGVLSSSDRSALKRRIKDVQNAAEKERKALDKLEKQKEKQRRKEQEQRRT